MAKVTKIERIEKIGDCSSEVREMIPEWIDRCEAELAEFYPGAEVSIRTSPDSGSSELHVEADTRDYQDEEKFSTEIAQPMSDVWERYL